VVGFLTHTRTAVLRAADRAIPGALPSRRERQPAEREDPLAPQHTLEQLTADERGSFLQQYQEAVEHACDPAGRKELRRVLQLWRFHADAAGDAGYREALGADRGPVSGGMALEEAVRARFVTDRSDSRRLPRKQCR